MTERLHGDGQPWFVRCRTKHGCNLRPASMAGWLLTLFYVLGAIGLSLLLVDDGAGAGRWIAWGVLLAATTFAYLLSAWRMSEPADCAAAGKDRRRRRRAG